MRLPAPVVRLGRRILPATARRSAREILAELRWQLDPRAIESRRRLASFRDRFRGQRCVIIGNGPSLKHTDLTRLRHEVTFGLNRIYLLFEELGFSTTFLVCVNRLVLEQFHRDLEALDCPRFLAWHARESVAFQEGLHFVRSLPTALGFSSDPGNGWHEGCTVTFCAMQLAFFMGFETVVLVGVDHSFVSKGAPHREVTSQGDDPNHFHAGYFGKGVRWQLPDLAASEQAYLLARSVFTGDGRQILDATIGGKLTVFPKCSYDELFG